MLPHEDNVLNKFRIWKKGHVQMRKPYQSPGRMKNSSYYIAPVGVRTHDLPHTVASNMVKVSHALTHSATAAVYLFVTSHLHAFSIVCLAFLFFSFLLFPHVSLFSICVPFLYSSHDHIICDLSLLFIGHWQYSHMLISVLIFLFHPSHLS